jgi:hypothetical protein
MVERLRGVLPTAIKMRMHMTISREYRLFNEDAWACLLYDHGMGTGDGGRLLLLSQRLGVVEMGICCAFCMVENDR